MAMTRFRVEMEISIDAGLLIGSFKDEEMEFDVERLVENSLAKDDVIQGNAIILNIGATKIKERR